MTIRKFEQSVISPNAMGVFHTAFSRRINLRDVHDTGGSHMISFGARCVVADPLASTLDMYMSYETPNGQLRSVHLPAPIDLTVITEAGGGMWYAPEEMVVDVRYPLGDGPGLDPYGTWFLHFGHDPAGSTPGLCKVSYECRVTTDDGNGSVIYYP